MASVLPRPRHSPSLRPERLARERATGLPPRPVETAYLDRTFYHLRTAAGDLCAGRVWQGRCLLLFSSPRTAAAFAERTGVESGALLIFSCRRSEFLTQAAQCFGQGFIGGLIDARDGTGKTEFLSFDVARHSVGL
jgi:hypothetical protein